MLSHFSIKYPVFALYAVSIAYTQFRGKVKLKFLQQLVNHSAIMAPINAIMYLFSATENKPFPDLKQFPELAELQNHWLTFQEEAKQLLAEGHIKAAETNNDMGFNSFFKRGWKRFYIKWYGDQYIPSANELCPKTVAILKKFPKIKGAMFTLLPKHGQLKPHRDPYAGSLRYHLGLITPNSDLCRIYVDDQFYSWRDGEGVLFDETYIHSAKNETDTDRIIFFCDIERPLNNKAARFINRIFSQLVMAQSITQNLPSDPVGFFNRAFSYYHRLMQPLKRLKKQKPIYYRLLQYGFFAALIYFLFA